MKISRITAYQVDLPLKEGRYSWSNDNAVEVFDATVVCVETDAGIAGWAECTPLGSAYLPAYAGGVRAGLKELAPKLIGLDPRELGPLNRRMDEALRGHPYVKSPIDIACWDILGKATGLPVVTLLGGRQMQDIKLYRAISQEAPDTMAKKIAGYKKEGYRKFQLKAGGSADDDMPTPTADTLQILSSPSTERAPTWGLICLSSNSNARGKSPRLTVNEKSAKPSWPTF